MASDSGPSSESQPRFKKGDTPTFCSATDDGLYGRLRIERRLDREVQGFDWEGIFLAHNPHEPQAGKRLCARDQELFDFGPFS